LIRNKTCSIFIFHCQWCSRNFSPYRKSRVHLLCDLFYSQFRQSNIIKGNYTLWIYIVGKLVSCWTFMASSLQTNGSSFYLFLFFFP
jgi:hypothetical protein